MAVDEWRVVARGLSCVLFGVTGYCVCTFPIAQVPLGLGVACLIAVLLKWPYAWTAVLPAILPVIDLTPLSGRFFFNEFDICVMAAIGANLWQGSGFATQVRPPSLAVVFAALLATSYTLGIMVAFSHARGEEFQWIGAYLNPYNAFRAGKPCLYALTLWAFLARTPKHIAARWRLFLVGSAIGAAGLVIVVLVERIRFPGLFDFSSDFRALGAFSTMHTGGAHIDAYLVLTVPLFAAFWPRARNIFTRAAVILLAVGVAYVVLVTMSRATLVIAAVQAMAAVIYAGLTSASTRQALVSGVVALAILGLGAAMMWETPFLRKRFLHSTDDWQVRVAHCARRLT